MATLSIRFAMLGLLRCAAAVLTHSAMKKTVTARDSYDYPESLVSPPDFWLGFVALELHGTTIQEFETPIAVYQTIRLDQIMWNCIAAYHPTALDSAAQFGDERLFGDPVHRVTDTALHTSQNRVLCSAYAINSLLVNGLNHIAVDGFQQRMTTAGLSVDIPTTDELDGFTDQNTPYVVGHRLALHMLDMMRQDGSNFDGALARDGTACPATKKCPIYGDTTNYVPPHDAWVNSSTLSVELDSLWKPQLETDGLGFVSANGHITPHFGNMDTWIVKKTETPVLDGYVEADGSLQDLTSATLQTMRDVFNSKGVDQTLAEVSFMNNKINMAGGLITRYRERFNASFEEQVYYHTGFTTAEMDSVIRAWGSKVAHSRVRPTTVIQEGRSGLEDSDGNIADTWDGTGRGSVKHTHWDSMNRLMPHAEYPSGSGAICTVVTEYLHELVVQEKGLTDFSTEWDVGTGLTFDTLRDMRDRCGDSRVFGGMHFRKAVDDSYTLVAGVGHAAYHNFVTKLLGGGHTTFASAFPAGTVEEHNAAETATEADAETETTPTHKRWGPLAILSSLLGVVALCAAAAIPKR